MLKSLLQFKHILMKLIALVIVLLAVYGTQAGFARNKHTTAQNHEIFETSWVGTESSACDQACRGRGKKVCGRFTKECCNQECSYKWWGTNQYCKESSVVQDLQCSVIQSITGKYWNGDACNSVCERAGGKVCGKTNKECCETGCDAGILTETCLDSKPKEIKCAAN